MLRFEPVLHLVWVALGAAIVAYAASIGIIGSSGPESGFFPALAGLLIGGGGAIQLLPGSAGMPPGLPFWSEGSRSARRVLLMGGVVALAIAAIPFAGFILATLVAMPLLVRLVGGTRWWVACLIGVVSVFGVSRLFDTALGVTLPRGPFGF